MTHPSYAAVPQQKYKFINQSGIELCLTVDLRRKTGLLSCRDFGDVIIRKVRIESQGLVLLEDEERWLAGVWYRCFRRRLKKLPYRLAAEEAQRATDPSSRKQAPDLYYAIPAKTP